MAEPGAHLETKSIGESWNWYGQDTDMHRSLEEYPEEVFFVKSYPEDCEPPFIYFHTDGVYMLLQAKLPTFIESVKDHCKKT